MCIVSFLKSLLLENLFRSLGVATAVFVSYWFELLLALASVMFSFFFLALVVCILYVSTSFWHLVVAEAKCNWYLLDINIFFLSKKKVKATSRLETKTENSRISNSTRFGSNSLLNESSWFFILSIKRGWVKRAEFSNTGLTL